MTNLPRDRGVALVYREGYTVREIADAYGLAYGTVYRILVRPAGTHAQPRTAPETPHAAVDPYVRATPATMNPNVRNAAPSQPRVTRGPGFQKAATTNRTRAITQHNI